jgi:hypothetical protein
MTDPGAKAEAARLRELHARRKARKNTIVLGVGLFALVFTLLSYKLVNGTDAALGDQTQAAQVPQQQFQQPQVQPEQFSDDDDGWSGDDGDEGDDDEDWEDQQQQSPQQSQDQSGPPTSRAS